MDSQRSHNEEDDHLENSSQHEQLHYNLGNNPRQTLPSQNKGRINHQSHEQVMYRESMGGQHNSHQHYQGASNQVDYSSHKSLQQQTPMHSQYNALANKREGSAKREQHRWASSNGFKGSNQFQTLQSNKGGRQQMNEQSCFQSIEQNQSNACSSCTVNARALSYSSLYTANSIVYSQNVPAIVHSGSLDSVNIGGGQSARYLRFEIEVLKSQLMQAQGPQIRGSHNSTLQAPIGANNGSNGDILFFTISDDTNPLFLYLASIDVTKFLRMRREQNIFVEFSQFADKVQALLDFCIANREEVDDANRFISVINLLPDVEEESETMLRSGLNSFQAILDVFEHNEFRNLLHLRMEFKRATAEETSSWLAKKILMQRKLNVDLQQDNFELADQHDQDRQRINQIKQSLIALKNTQNEELQRIKEEHESHLENADEVKLRDLGDLKNSYEQQIQDLTQEFEERLQEIKQDADSLREELSKSQVKSNQLNEAIHDKEIKVDEQSNEINDLHNEREKMVNRIEDLRESNNKFDKRLLEQTLMKEQLQKELERQEITIEHLKAQLQMLEDQNQGQEQVSDTYKDNLLVANEQNKQLESENQRLNQTISQLHEKVLNIKDKRNKVKRDFKNIREEKGISDGRIEQQSLQIEEIRNQTEKMLKELESREKLLDQYEQKLKEDQQTLVSNKNLIEFLNKSLNEAQKFSFRTIVNQKPNFQQQTYEMNNHYFGENIGTGSTSALYTQTRMNTISPLRCTSAAIPRLETGKLQNNQSTRYLHNKPVRHNMVPSTTQPLLISQPLRPQDTMISEVFRPSASNLNLPMTEYYLSKHGQTNNLHKPPQIPTNQRIMSSSTKQFNHLLNNPFSQQLERERIISEEKLKQRFDDVYQSKYQPGTQQQNQTLSGVPSTSNLPPLNLYLNNFQQQYHHQVQHSRIASHSHSNERVDVTYQCAPTQGVIKKESTHSSQEDDSDSNRRVIQLVDIKFEQERHQRERVESLLQEE